jgi:predicted amidohydrolase
VQLHVVADVESNTERAEAGVRDAAQRGADLVVLPEKWPALGTPEEVAAGATTIDSPLIDSVRSWARELGIWLVPGSFVERGNGVGKSTNTSILITPDGDIVATYRKMHMFDVEVQGVVYRESDHEDPGSDIVVADAAGTKLGMTICYDLRFPELYRILALMGAEVLLVPAAFTLNTGRDHWDVLLRARAIENQCFVVAANAYGDHGHGKVSYGRSKIVDPWGIVLAQAPDGDQVIVADLDMRTLTRVRTTLPSLASRRPSAYHWPA